MWAPQEHKCHVGHIAHRIKSWPWPAFVFLVFGSCVGLNCQLRENTWRRKIIILRFGTRGMCSGSLAEAITGEARRQIIRIIDKPFMWLIRHLSIRKNNHFPLMVNCCFRMYFFLTTKDTNEQNVLSIQNICSCFVNPRADLFTCSFKLQIRSKAAVGAVYTEWPPHHLWAPEGDDWVFYHCYLICRKLLTQCLSMNYLTTRPWEMVWHNHPWASELVLATSLSPGGLLGRMLPMEPGQVLLLMLQPLLHSWGLKGERFSVEKNT